MRVRVIGCLAAFTLATADLAAQPAPSFRTGVDLVRLDVRVHDADGRPIKDIRQDELRVIENGAERPVVFFQHVDDPDGEYLDVARRTIGSEVSTNRGAPRGHLYVLVFDQQHIAPGNEQRARHAAERFLRTRVRPGDRVALYGLPGPGPRLGFTGDVERVVAALTSVRGMLQHEAMGRVGVMRTHEAYEIARGNDRVLSRVATRLASQGGGTDVASRRSGRAGGAAAAEPDVSMPRVVQEDARAIVANTDGDSRQSLLGLEALMHDLRAVDGRKAIILISEGFHPDNLAREIERVAAAAARVYGVIYALDIGQRANTVALDNPAENTAAEVSTRLEPLGSLAAETDGRLFADANSWTDGVMDRIATESQAYYLVGFAPSENARRAPAEYHRIEVRATRPGAHVSTRTGYALEEAPPTPADRRRAVDLALAAPYPLQEVPLHFTTYTLRGDQGGRQRVVMTLEAELPGSNRPADVVFAVRRAGDGRLAASGSDRLAAPAANTEAGATRYRVQFELDAGEYLMRVVVRDAGGLIGSADRRFAVRPLASRDLSVSDLIFSTPDGGLAVRPYGYAGDRLSGALEVYGGTRAQLERASVVVDLIDLEGTAVRSIVAEALPVSEGPSGAVRPIRIDLPLDAIPPGEYIARARLLDGRDIAGEVSRDVEVIPGSMKEDSWLEPLPY